MDKMRKQDLETLPKIRSQLEDLRERAQCLGAEMTAYYIDLALAEVSDIERTKNINSATP